MKNIFTYIFLILVLSCSSTNLKEKLIGNWYSSTGNKIDSEFKFHKDSLIIIDSNGWKYTLRWKVDSNNIYTSYLKEAGPIYQYELNENDQSLSLELIDNDSTKPFEFVKAKNSYDFFQKLIGMKMELPIKEIELKQMGPPPFEIFNIYAGYDNDSLVVKTDLASDLNNLENEVNEFKENARDELKPFLKFGLIADKNIPAHQIDSIKEKLTKTSIKQIYRAYKNKQTHLENDIMWNLYKE